MLQRLCEFAERIPDRLPSMYGELSFKWQIELTDDGTFDGITPLSDGSKKDKGLKLVTPNLKRQGTKAPPLLLADNAKYVLGIGASMTDKFNHFKAFRELVNECADATDESAVRAVSRFLAAYEAEPRALGPDIEPGDNMVFRVGGCTRPIDLKSVRDFWLNYNSSDCDQKMQCIVCGKTSPVDRVSPIAIKGIPGGQSSGMAIVSANKNAFESYGAEQALVAPTCRSCGEAYANSINYMIQNKEHHVIVGPTVFVFWTVGNEQFNIGSFLSQPQPEQLRNLILSCHTGREQHGLDADAFYALSLSASNARVVVRDWINTTVSSVQSNLARWFVLQRIINADGQEGDAFGVTALATSTCTLSADDSNIAQYCYKEHKPLPGKLQRKIDDQMVAEVPRSLVRCALLGGQLPYSLLSQAVARNRAEQSVARVRAALIKAVLLSQDEDHEENYMEKLDITCKNPGYLCGRLFAELEATQIEAHKPRKLNSTIADRYYGSASSSPATVMGHLFRKFQENMMTCRKDNEGAFRAIDKRVQDILSEIDKFPKTLKVEDQAYFALGYYHQKAENRAAMLAHVAKSTDNGQEETD